MLKIFFNNLGSIMLSDNFMDALGAQAVIKKAKIVGKKLNSSAASNTEHSNFVCFLF